MRDLDPDQQQRPNPDPGIFEPKLQNYKRISMFDYNLWYWSVLLVF